MAMMDSFVFPKSHRDLWQVEDSRKMHQTFRRNDWYVLNAPSTCKMYLRYKEKEAFFFNKLCLIWLCEYNT